MGVNAARVRTGMWQPSTWKIEADGAVNGASVIATNLNGWMFFIPLSNKNSGAYSLTDSQMVAKHVLMIEGENSAGFGAMHLRGNMDITGTIDIKSGAFVKDFLKVNGSIIAKDLELTFANW